MNNGNIANKQNEQLNLERISAFEQLYISAKRMKTLQVLLSVVILIIISYLKKTYENTEDYIFLDWNWEKISPYLSLLSVIITFLNLYLFKYLLSFKVKEAAYIQYDFDCCVLNIEKNTFLNKETPYEEIKKQSDKRLKKKPIEKFKNWYPKETAEVEFDVGRFICLRSNYVWDISLRKFHRNGISVIFSIIVLVIIVMTFSDGTTFRGLVIEIIIPLLPLITLFLTEIIDNNKTIDKKEKGLNIINGVWRKYLQKNVDKNDLEIFFKECLESLHNLRIENPLIANWENKLLKESNESRIKYGAQGLIKEYQDNFK